MNEPFTSLDNVQRAAQQAAEREVRLIERGLLEALVRGCGVAVIRREPRLYEGNMAHATTNVFPDERIPFGRIVHAPSVAALDSGLETDPPPELTVEELKTLVVELVRWRP